MFFHDIIDSCFSRDRYQWNYYATELSINPLSFPDRSYEFIYQYFKNGAKEYAVSLADQCFIAPTDFCSNSNPKSMNFVKLAPLRISKYRAAHTVQLIFLAFFLQNNFIQLWGKSIFAPAETLSHFLIFGFCFAFITILDMLLKKIGNQIFTLKPPTHPSENVDFLN